GGLHPPLALLGPVAIAPGRLLGLKAGQPDEPAIPGHPRGRSEPAWRAGRQPLRPQVERGVHLLRVAHLASDYLNKHRQPPPFGPSFSQLGSYPTLRPPTAGHRAPSATNC